MRIDMHCKKVVTAGLAAVALVVGGPVVVYGSTPPAQKCGAAKSKAAAKNEAAQLKCYATATVHGTQVDAACLTAAETKFGAAITKAEAAGGCAVTGDAGAIEAAVEAFVGAIVALTPANATTTTVTSATSTTSTLSSSCSTYATNCGSCGAGACDALFAPYSADPSCEGPPCTCCECLDLSTFDVNTQCVSDSDCQPGKACGLVLTNFGSFGSCMAPCPTNPTTTTTTVPPSVKCCEGTLGCTWGSSSGCPPNPTFPYSPGPPGSVCDSSGSCSASTSPGDCCQLSAGQGCAVTSSLVPDLCSQSGGQIIPNTICMPDGTCQQGPPTTTTTPASTTTTTTIAPVCCFISFTGGNVCRWSDDFGNCITLNVGGAGSVCSLGGCGEGPPSPGNCCQTSTQCLVGSIADSECMLPDPDGLGGVLIPNAVCGPDRQCHPQ